MSLVHLAMVAPIVMAALLSGFLGSGHCIGMCGGLLAAFGAGDRLKHPLPGILAYHAGRLSTYMMLGAAAGLLSMSMLPASFHLWMILRWLAAVMLVLMGLYMAGWSRALLFLEKAGFHIWKRVQPLSRKFLPIRTLPTAYAAGLIWGLLPCGLVYSALILSATTASAGASALSMLAFGVGTLPSMLLGSFFLKKLQDLMRRYPVRQASGILLILAGLWTLLVPRLMPMHMHHPVVSPSMNQPAHIMMPGMVM